jgi:N-acetylmuramoyl-L-alanine amidase
VEEVVFQKSGGSAQFSPTIDGRFESVVISDETIEAVDMVLAGADNSQGALFFSARSKADPDNMSWFDKNLKWLFAYGGHEFYTLP